MNVANQESERSAYVLRQIMIHGYQTVVPLRIEP